MNKRSIQWMMIGFALKHVPLILLCRPKVMEVSVHHLIIKMPLYWMTKNHVRSMYFGVLAIGSDLACGMMAMLSIKQSEQPVSLIFKSVTISFLKRAESDVIFECKEGERIQKMIQKTLESGERVTEKCVVTAFESNGEKEPVAKCVLELSLKSKKRQ